MSDCGRAELITSTPFSFSPLSSLSPPSPFSQHEVGSRFDVLISSTAVQAASVLRRQQGGCTKYTIVNTRGTGEMQGPSAGFRSCNSQLMAKVSGGTEYNTEYSANFMQMSAGGTSDIVSHVNSALSSDPSMCFVLEGYSQGAMATVNALPKLASGAAFNAIVAVMLVGNPAHPGGMQHYMAPNTDQWTSKILDICATGDPVCGKSTPGAPTFGGHLSYPASSTTQSKMAEFAATALQRGSGNAASEGGCASAAPATSNSSSGSVLPGLKRLMGGMGGFSSLMGGSSSTDASTTAAGGAGVDASTTASSSPAAGACSSSTTPASSTQTGGKSALSSLSSFGLKRELIFRIIKRMISIPQAASGAGPYTLLRKRLLSAGVPGLPSAHVLPGDIGASTGPGGFGASLGMDGATLSDPVKGTKHVTWAQMAQDAQTKAQSKGAALPSLSGSSPLSGTGGAAGGATGALPRKRLLAAGMPGLPSAHVLPGNIGASTGPGGFGASLGMDGATLSDPVKGTKHVTWAQMAQDAQTKAQNRGAALPSLSGSSPLSGSSGATGGTTATSPVSNADGTTAGSAAGIESGAGTGAGAGASADGATAASPVSNTTGTTAGTGSEAGSEAGGDGATAASPVSNTSGTIAGIGSQAGTGATQSTTSTPVARSEDGTSHLKRLAMPSEPLKESVRKRLLYAGIPGLPNAHVVPGSIGATTGAGEFGASLGMDGATLKDPVKGTQHISWAQMAQNARAKKAAQSKAFPGIGSAANGATGVSPISNAGGIAGGSGSEAASGTGATQSTAPVARSKDKRMQLKRLAMPSIPMMKIPSIPAMPTMPTIAGMPTMPTIPGMPTMPKMSSTMGISGANPLSSLMGGAAGGGSSSTTLSTRSEKSFTKRLMSMPDLSSLGSKTGGSSAGGSSNPLASMMGGAAGGGSSSPLTSMMSMMKKGSAGSTGGSSTGASDPTAGAATAGGSSSKLSSILSLMGKKPSGSAADASSNTGASDSTAGAAATTGGTNTKTNGDVTAGTIGGTSAGSTGADGTTGLSAVGSTGADGTTGGSTAGSTGADGTTGGSTAGSSGSGAALPATDTSATNGTSAASTGGVPSTAGASAQGADSSQAPATSRSIVERSSEALVAGSMTTDPMTRDLSRDIQDQLLVKRVRQSKHNRMARKRQVEKKSIAPSVLI